MKFPSMTFTLPALTLAGCLLVSFMMQTIDTSPRREGGVRRELRRNLDGGSAFGPGRGPNPMGGMREALKLVKPFDQDGDKRLNADERKAAREYLTKQKPEGQGMRRRGPWGRGENKEPPTPGPKVSPQEVKFYPEAPLYNLPAFRTFFLEFENKDWEAELSDFYRTDVEVPATLTVDGKTYQEVGVHFRGATSFFMVEEGRKRSFNLTMDLVHKDQHLGGYRTLNLLNSHTDPTFLRTVLYYQAARDYIPAPKANYARLVINGEHWGVYINAQQFNKDFVQDWFGTTKGARWKVPGSPRGRGGLDYLGDDPAPYKRIYEIKTKDEPKSWAALIRLCQVLKETPLDQLEQALSPLLDLEGTLKFLALENVFINNDGYWIRASDFNIILDEKGRFHFTPHDANETFRTPEGPGWNGGLNVTGVELDPLTGADDPNKSLLHKLLAVPDLRERYFAYIRQIAEKWLDWNKLGALAKQYQDLIAEDVQRDTRKLYPWEAFTQGVTEDTEEQGYRGPRQSISLKSFVEQRRAYLLNHPAVKLAGR